MRTRSQLALSMLAHARANFDGSLRGVTVDEALQPAGGHRSILGILKHAAAWSHVYHSYAFEAQPRHWRYVDWPRGMRDIIDPTQEYLDEIVAWFARSADQWAKSLQLSDAVFDEPRPLHMGAKLPLFDIVVMVAAHWTYHAGEMNALTAILRGHAWEYTEEVEENHVSTAGHRLKPDWMPADQVVRYEAYLAMRDQQLHGRPQS